MSETSRSPAPVATGVGRRMSAGRGGERWGRWAARPILGVYVIALSLGLGSQAAINGTDDLHEVLAVLPAITLF